MTGSGHSPAEVDWDAACRRLLVGYGDAAHLPHHAVAALPATVVLDEHGCVIDVDIKALPDRVAHALATYAVSAGRPPKNGIALDADAAWLWLHLADGVPARRLGGTAHVRIALDGTEIVEVELTMLPTTTPTPGDSR